MAAPAMSMFITTFTFVLRVRFLMRMLVAHLLLLLLIIHFIGHTLIAASLHTLELEGQYVDIIAGSLII